MLPACCLLALPWPAPVSDPILPPVHSQSTLQVLYDEIKKLLNPEAKPSTE